MNLESCLDEFPALAILRGASATDIAEVGLALTDSGWRAMEVPLNREGGLDALRVLLRSVPDGTSVGAGTVTSVRQLEAVAEAGGHFAVSPHLDLELVAAAGRLGLAYAPGVMTPSEWYAAHRAGATAVKLFPFDALTPSAVTGMLAVAPAGMPTIAVGGVSPHNLGEVFSIGVDAVGMATSLYRPGDPAEVVRERAQLVASAISEVGR